MHRVIREAAATGKLLAAVGPAGAAQTAIQGWPVFDSLMGIAVYHNNRPVVVSTVLAERLGMPGRTSKLERVPPPAVLRAAGFDMFNNPDVVPRLVRRGSWTVVFVTEVAVPVPIRSMTPSDAAIIPTSKVDLLNIARAGGAAAVEAPTKWLWVDDRVGVIGTAFELSEALGYRPRDHCWVPDRWRFERVDAGFRCGYETVRTSDGVDATLRFFSYRCRGLTVFLVRLWFGDRVDCNLQIG